MIHKTASTAGIRDWAKKLELIRQLCGALTPLMVADYVLDRPGQDLIAASAADSFRKWHRSVPKKQDGPAQFWEALPEKLGCATTVTGTILLEASIERFIECLPPDKQNLARMIVEEYVKTDGASSPSLQLASSSQGTLAQATVIRLQYRGDVETIATGLQNGRISQQHYYLDPGSADAWFRLVRAENYPTYDHCKSALVSLLNSREWREALAKSSPTTIVMLAGGGAPSKDLKVIRNVLSLTDPGTEIHFYLLDISMYMMRESERWLREQLATQDGGERVKVELIHSDLLQLHSDHRSWFHRHGPVVFGLTGITVGNVSETSLFQSLDHVAEDGDILFIGAETVDGIPSVEVQETIRKKYDSRELRHFLRPVVRAVLSEAGSRESADEALRRIKVSLRQAGYRHCSDIPESWSVLVTLELNGREIILLTSTRYVSSQLIDHAVRFGWMNLGYADSPINPDYKQFLFVRKKLGSSGSNGHSASVRSSG